MGKRPRRTPSRRPATARSWACEIFSTSRGVWCLHHHPLLSPHPPVPSNPYSLDLGVVTGGPLAHRTRSASGCSCSVLSFIRLEAGSSAPLAVFFLRRVPVGLCACLWGCALALAYLSLNASRQNQAK